MNPVNDVLRGIVAIVASQLAFVINDTFVKLATETLPMGEIIFVRGVLATILIGAVAVALGAHRHLSRIFDRRVGWRVVGEIGAMFFYIAALVHMPIANVIIIFQATPLAVTAAAALFIGETVGWRRWLAIGVGFAGVLVVVRPGLTGFDAYAILVLISVLFVALRDIATRKLPASVTTVLITFATAVSVMISGAVFSVFETWTMPSASAFAYIAAAAVLLSIGHATVIYAMRVGEMSVTASFRYTAVVIAIASGYFIWGDTLDALTILGTTIIVATGLYTLYRERQVARAGSRLVAAPAAIDPPLGG